MKIKLGANSAEMLKKFVKLCTSLYWIILHNAVAITHLCLIYFL